MGGLLKAILVILVLLFLAPALLGVMGVAFALLISSIAVPIGILGALIGGFFGLIGGLFGLSVFLVRTVFWILLAAACVWFLTFLVKRSGNDRPSRHFEENETADMKDIHRGIRKMEERLESLEVLLGKDR